MLLAVLVFPAGRALADEVVFHNGDRINGTVTKLGDGKLTIGQTRFGTVTVDLIDVKSFTAATRITAATQPSAQNAVATTAPVSPPAPALAAKAPPIPPAPIPPAPIPPPPPKRWSGAITATALVTRGNSTTETFRLAFDAQRKGDDNLLTLAAGYAFGQTEEPDTGERATNIDNWFASAKLDYSLGPKWYNYALIRVEEDNIANLGLRVAPGIGIGYRWINEPDVHFNTELGVNWVYEVYDNDGHNDHFAIRLAYHLDKKLNDKVSLVHNLEYLPSVEGIDNFNINADLGIRAMLTERLFTEFKAEWRHDSTPAPGARSNDLRYTVGAGWKF